MKHVLTTLIGALVLYSVSPNSLAAEPPDSVSQKTVRFGDLDLTRPAGAQELYGRIRHAARDVCETMSAGGFAAAIRNRICTEQAIAQAVAAVDSPLLTAHYELSTHHEILQPQQAGLNR